MPDSAHLVTVARRYKALLNGHAFMTVRRTEVTQAVREVSGEDTTRIKAAMGAKLEKALLEQGVRCHPPLSTTTTGDTIRLFHTGSVLGSLVDLIIHPSPSNDRDLGAVIKKVKGQWDWCGGPGHRHDQPDAHGREPDTGRPAGAA
jgi:hypothetical protein